MKAILRVPINVEEAFKGLSDLLVKDSFTLSEEDRTYVVEYHGVEAEKQISSIRFWSRRALGGKYHPSFSLTIEGEVKKDDDGSVIELELIEYHVRRQHALKPFLEEYLDKLIRSVQNDPSFRRQS